MEALRKFDDERDERIDMYSENLRLYEQLLRMETKVDMLSDRESSFEQRAKYWRKMYCTLVQMYKSLERKHSCCSNKPIILYH